MYWTHFWQTTVNVQQNIFVKSLIEVGSPHIYASFGTFCTQIGQIFAAQWVFEHSEELRNRRYFPSMTTICWFLNIFQRLNVPRITSNNWPIWAQKVPKEAQKCGVPTSIRVSSKMFCCTWTVGCQKFVQYIRMLWPGRFILGKSVHYESF